MAIIVEGPGGVEVEFPDGTSHDVMAAAMRKHFGGGQPAAPVNDGSGGVGPDYEAIGADKTPLLGFVEALGNGAFANWGDEASAAAGSVPNLVTGGKLGKDYRTILNETRDRRKLYAEEHPDAARVGETTGALGMAAVPGAGFVARAPGLLSGVARGALASGLMGAANRAGEMEGEHSPGEYAGEMASGAALPAMIGGGLPLAGSVAGRVVGPWMNQAARYLHDRGVQLTPGQVIGPGVSRMEEGLNSVPFLGNMLRRRRAEGTDTFNRAAWTETLDQLPGPATGKTLAPDIDMGHEAAAEVKDMFRRHYGAAVPRLRAEADAPLTNEIARLSGRLPQSVRPQFAEAYRRHVTANMDATTGRFSGRAIQDSLQGLRKEAQNLRTVRGNAYDVDLADALDGVRNAMEASAQRYSTVRNWNAFQRVNRAYRSYVPLRDAGSRLGTEGGLAAAETPGAGGVFRPAQVLSAVRAADKSVAKNMYGLGDTPMQELAQTGKNVMGEQLRDSGTAERLAIGALLGGAGYSAPVAGLPAAVAALGLYSHSGNRAFQHLAAYSPQTRAAIRRAIERATKTAAPAASEMELEQ